MHTPEPRDAARPTLPRSVPCAALPPRSRTRLLPLGAALLGGIALGAPVAHAQDTGTAAATTRETTAAASDGALPAAVVEGERERDGSLASRTRVGKQLQNPHDVPQAVTTVTRSLMEEQNVGSLREALRNVAGLTFNAAEGGRSGDNMNLRGFYTFGDMYLDGIRDTAQVNRETFNLEQIDVLRGAGAMLFGRGQAGGVINQVTKTPQLQSGATVGATVGTSHTRDLRADLNTRFTKDTGLRINAMARTEGSWRSNPVDGAQPDLNRHGIALSGATGQYGDRAWYLNYMQLSTRDNPDYGVSFDPATRRPGAQLPASTLFGNRRTFDDSDTRITTLVNEWRLSPAGEGHEGLLRTQVRHANYDRSYWAKTPSLTTLPDATGGIGGNQTRTSFYETVTVQSDLSGRFNGAGLTHDLLGGVELLREDGWRKALQNVGTTAAPLFNPYQAAGAGVPVTFTGESRAVYAQDTIGLDRWKLTLGTRRDELRADYPANATSPQLKFGEWSSRAALSFHVDEATHTYLAWSDSFSPTADLYQLTVTPQPPERSAVVELGAKLLLLDGNLAARAALYAATKNWERNTDLESTATILTRKRRTRGLELELAGRIGEHWEIFSGLALMDAKILAVAENVNATTGAVTTANAGYVGQRPRNTPPYAFNAWLTWHDGPLKLGAGVEGKGKRYGFVPTGAGAVPTLPGDTAFHPNTAPAYARVDLMAEWTQRIGRNEWTLRLNLRNLFDRVYYDAIYDNGGFTIPGTRRVAMLTAEAKL